MDMKPTARVVAAGSSGKPDFPTPRKFVHVPGPTHTRFAPTGPPAQVLVQAAGVIALKVGGHIVSTAKMARNANVGLVEYLSAVAVYCVGPQGTDTALAAQHPGWLPLIASTHQLAAMPVPSAAEAVSLRKAQAYIEVRVAKADEIYQFMTANYRVLPAPPTLSEVKGWFKWSVRLTLDAGERQYQDYLQALVAFAEPKVPEGAGPNSLGTLLAELAPWLAVAGAGLARARSAAANTTLPPSELGPFIEQHVVPVRQAITAIDQAIRSATATGRF